MRGDFPEAPPREVAGLGVRPGFTIQEYPSLDALDAAGRAAGVSASDCWNAHRIASFVDMKNRVVGLLSRDATNDDGLYDARLAHEAAHTWGLIHNDDGKGWAGPQYAWDWIRMSAGNRTAQSQQAYLSQVGGIPPT